MTMPIRITIEQADAALKALGFDQSTERIMSITITAGDVTVVTFPNQNLLRDSHVTHTTEYRLR